MVRARPAGRPVGLSVCVSVLDGRKLGPEWAKQPTEITDRARPCPYVSSVQETSRCCKEEEERREGRREGGREADDDDGAKPMVALLRVASSAVHSLRLRSARPPARPPKSRVHPALQWSTLSSSSTEAAGEAAAGGAVWSVAPSPRQSRSAGR